MEFSKYLGVSEGCSSSESGWTMYIVSPMHEANYNHHHHHHHHHHHVIDDDDDGVDEIHDDDYNMHKSHDHQDSDDSMVSDASSGPSRRQGITSKRQSGLRKDHASKSVANEGLIGKNQRQVGKLYERRQRGGKEDYKNRNDNKARKTN